MDGPKETDTIGAPLEHISKRRDETREGEETGSKERKEIRRGKEREETGRDEEMREEIRRYTKKV